MADASQMMLQLQLIPHEVDGVYVPQRMADGYVNATAMCKASEKQMKHYLENKTTRDFLAELSRVVGIPTTDLVIVTQGGRPELQGTWVHPKVAINLGQWCSAKFAVAVAHWVEDWMMGRVKVKAVLPYHIMRYMANRSEIPHTHWSMLNELTFAIIAPLESEGYTLPDSMVPDISEGKMFCNWLRKVRGVEPSVFPSYTHRYADGRAVSARLYPNELLAEFRAHLHGVWIPTRMMSYFQEKDPKALAYLPKLLPASATV
jgi:hypothetical protein